MNRENQTDDRQLVERILKDDREAFIELVELYKRVVAHVVGRMITSGTDREDICQDIFVKVYRTLRSFRFECKLSSWIGRIAYTTCINYLQKTKTALLDDLDSFASSGPTPDREMSESDISKRIWAEIDALDVRYRTILTLYHLEEMNYEEIGQIMNLPGGTVKSYLHRARKLLKERVLTKYQKEELCLTDI